MSEPRTRYVCSRCRTEFDTQELCDKHVKLHASEVAYKRICLRLFNTGNWSLDVNNAPADVPGKNPELKVFCSLDSGLNAYTWTICCEESQLLTAENKLYDIAYQQLHDVIRALHGLVLTRASQRQKETNNA